MTRANHTAPIPFSVVLDAADEALRMVEQWSRNLGQPEWAGRVYAYTCKAEALVELVEVAFCGSTGGHAQGQTAAERASMPARIAYLREHACGKPQQPRLLRNDQCLDLLLQAAEDIKADDLDLAVSVINSVEIACGLGRTVTTGTHASDLVKRITFLRTQL